MNKEFKELATYAKEYPEDIVWAVGSALRIDGIKDIIAAYKEGWNGDEGKFARIVSRALSQIE